MFLDRWAGDGVYNDKPKTIGGRVWYGYMMLEAQGQREKAFFMIWERNESHDKNKQTTSARISLKLKQFLYLSLNVS